MPASFSLELLAKEAIASAKTDGALGDDVLVQFLCNTGPGGEHDPDAEPDNRVRPSHAAYHGRIFKMSEAPVPPLDYGCRCAIRYIVPADSPLAYVVGATTDEEPVKPAVATAQWLDANVDDWRKVAREIKSVGPKDMLEAAAQEAKDLEIPHPRSIAEMVLEVVRSKLL